MKTYEVIVTKEPDGFIARCRDFLIAEKGSTKDEAIENLKKSMKCILDEHKKEIKPYKIKLEGEMITIQID